MSQSSTAAPSTAKVVAAFATVYIVWGSTYFFIRMSVEHMPPMIVGALRYLIAGALMLGWCIARGEKVFSWPTIRPAIISGLLLLLLGNGGLIWTEQYLTSSLAAILLAANPVWFVLLDKRKWKENFSSRETIIGLLVGLVGIVLLFGEQLMHSFAIPSGGAPAASGGPSASMGWEIVAMFVLIGASLCWAGGSLYSKYHSTGGSNSVNTGWQMFAAGVAFLPIAWGSGEFQHFHPQEVPMKAWLAVLYLVTMGSLVGYTAFIWLLQVRSATQVSTHAYVNPVVAVLLGVCFADEHMTVLQLVGLAIILGSVLLINLAKYRSSPATSAKTTHPSYEKNEHSVVVNGPKVAEH